MNKPVQIWQPISFDGVWATCDTSVLDVLAPSWLSKRRRMQEDNAAFREFMEQLKRQAAIETGVIEQLYDLSQGVTETFIKEGFVDAYVSHTDTNISRHQLMGYLKSQFDALDFVFDLVKQDRPLSVGFIKELHQLLTEHQDYTEAIGPKGELVKVKLLKGEFKQHNNNPKRNDGTVYHYCPPLQVQPEMEKLVNIHNKLIAGGATPVILSAWLHHAFTQIHPFQDGNGRVARLIASISLIRAGLFPLIVQRQQKALYIDALEAADGGSPQGLVTLFCEVQRNNIARILTTNLTDQPGSLAEVAQLFNKKVSESQKRQYEAWQQTVNENRNSVFKMVNEKVGQLKESLTNQIPEERAAIHVQIVPPNEEQHFYYTHQIVAYARQHQYYFNAKQPRGWFRFTFEISAKERYDLIITLHHYGYDSTVLAIGSFLEYKLMRGGAEDDNQHDEDTLLPVAVPPFYVSLENNPTTPKAKLNQHIEDIVRVGLATIINEID